MLLYMGSNMERPRARRREAWNPGKSWAQASHNVYGDKSGSGAMGRKVSSEEVAALKHQVPQDHSLRCGFSWHTFEFVIIFAFTS